MFYEGFPTYLIIFLTVPKPPLCWAGFHLNNNYPLYTFIFCRIQFIPHSFVRTMNWLTYLMRRRSLTMFGMTFSLWIKWRGRSEESPNLFSMIKHFNPKYNNNENVIQLHQSSSYWSS